jgi:hypothetical protein
MVSVREEVSLKKSLPFLVRPTMRWLCDTNICGEGEVESEGGR